MTQETDTKPWYKQFWPWFVLSPLIVVIGGGVFMTFVAVKTFDGPILDNFYKDGLTIVERTEQDDWARAHNLEASLQTIGDRVQLRLSGQLDSRPDSLKLLYAFRTQASRDVTVTLKRQPDGRYLGQLPRAIEGKRILELQPMGDKPEWLLRGGQTLPSSGIVTLQPRVE